MEDELNVFLDRVPNLSHIPSRGLVDYFVYFLTIIKGGKGAKTSEVENCYKVLRMHVPSVRQYLSEKTQRAKGKKPVFILNDMGYNLERSRKIELDEKIGNEPIKRETSKALNDLLEKLTLNSEQEFLREAIVCYDVHAYRAAIIMGWLLTLDHLYEYILKSHLVDFNTALSKNTDKRVKATNVQNKDDFGDIPEGKFIEFCRSANIISNDVRKILDEKLGTRNSCAHPSGIVVPQVKASAFLQDLVLNVIRKYPL